MIQGKWFEELKLYVPLCLAQRARGLAASSEAHAYPPRVVGENFVFFLHDTRVCAFVDGVGHYGDVVVFQGDVVWLRVLQQLPVFVPAEMGSRTSDTPFNEINEIGKVEGTRHLLYFAFL